MRYPATGVLQQLRSLPSPARQTITFVRGTEFARYSLLRHQLGIESYFCSPQAPWQKGTAENTNGRLRRFISPGMDPKGLTLDLQPDQQHASQVPGLPDTTGGAHQPLATRHVFSFDEALSAELR